MSDGADLRIGVDATGAEAGVNRFTQALQQAGAAAVAFQGQVNGAFAGVQVGNFTDPAKQIAALTKAMNGLSGVGGNLSGLQTAANQLDAVAKQLSGLNITGVQRAIGGLRREFVRINDMRVNTTNIQAASRGIEQALKNLNGLQTSGAVAAMDAFRKAANGLANIKVDTTNLATGIQALQRATAQLSSIPLQNLQAIFGSFKGASVPASFVNSIARLSAGLSNFQGPSPAALNSLRQFIAIGSTANVAQFAALAAVAQQMSRVRAAAAGTGGAGGGGFFGGFSAASGQISSATGALRGFENALHASYQASTLLRTAVGDLTLGRFVSSTFDIGRAYSSMKFSLDAVSTSAEETRKQLEFVNKLGKELPVDTKTTQQTYSKFAVASRLSGNKPEDIQKTYKDFATTFAVLKLDPKQQENAFLALEQMYSKGKVQAEELRRQLGQYLPGAFEQMAIAMGVSTAKLGQMMQAGQVGTENIAKLGSHLAGMFGGQLPSAMATSISQVQLLRNKITEFQTSVFENGFDKGLATMMATISKAMDGMGLEDSAKRVGSAFENAFTTLGDVAKAAIENWRVLAAVIGGIAGLGALSGVVALGTMIAGPLLTIPGLVAGATAALTGLGIWYLQTKNTTDELNASNVTLFDRIKATAQIISGSAGNTIFSDLRRDVMGAIGDVQDLYNWMMKAIEASKNPDRNQRGFWGNVVKGAEVVGGWVGSGVSAAVGSDPSRPGIGQQIENLAEANRRMDQASQRRRSEEESMRVYDEQAKAKAEADAKSEADRRMDAASKARRAEIMSMDAYEAMKGGPDAAKKNQNLFRSELGQVDFTNPAYARNAEMYRQMYAQKFSEKPTGWEDAAKTQQKELDPATVALKDYNDQLAILNERYVALPDGDPLKIDLDKYRQLKDRLDEIFKPRLDPFRAMVDSLKEQTKAIEEQQGKHGIELEFLKKKNELLKQGVDLTKDEAKAAELRAALRAKEAADPDKFFKDHGITKDQFSKSSSVDKAIEDYNKLRKAYEDAANLPDNHPQKLTGDESARRIRELELSTRDARDPLGSKIQDAQEQLALSSGNAERKFEIELLKVKQELEKKGVDFALAENQAKLQTLATLMKMNEESKKGGQNGFEQWANSTKSLKDSLNDVEKNAVDKLADSLTELVVKGKTDFASLGQSILMEINRAIIKDLLKKLIVGENGEGGLFGGKNGIFPQGLFGTLFNFGGKSAAEQASTATQNVLGGQTTAATAGAGASAGGGGLFGGLFGGGSGGGLGSIFGGLFGGGKAAAAPAAAAITPPAAASAVAPLQAQVQCVCTCTCGDDHGKVGGETKGEGKVTTPEANAAAAGTPGAGAAAAAVPNAAAAGANPGAAIAGLGAAGAAAAAPKGEKAVEAATTPPAIPPAPKTVGNAPSFTIPQATNPTLPTTPTLPGGFAKFDTMPGAPKLDVTPAAPAIPKAPSFTQPQDQGLGGIAGGLLKFDGMPGAPKLDYPKAAVKPDQAAADLEGARSAWQQGFPQNEKGPDISWVPESAKLPVTPTVPKSVETPALPPPVVIPQAPKVPAAPVNPEGLIGSFKKVGNYRDGVDPRLTDILKTTSERYGYNVQAISGVRAGDPRLHGRGMATDVRLIDKDGKALPNYQNAESFRDYEKFAQDARRVQMEKYPDLDQDFRWGGYFSGKNNYGALDTMHFDIGGKRVGMGGGSWEKGLTASQRQLWPNAVSKGMGPASQQGVDKRPADAGPTAGSRYQSASAPTPASAATTQAQQVGDASIGKATDFLKAHEGFNPNAYPDPDVPRIGYGSGTITNPDGTYRSARFGDVITREDAARDLQRRVPEFQGTARREIGADVWDKYDSNTKAGVTSLYYNYGSLGSKHPEVLSTLRTGNKDAIADAVQGMGAGKIRGLQNRRNDEAALIRRRDEEAKPAPKAEAPKAAAKKVEEKTAPKDVETTGSITKPPKPAEPPKDPWETPAGLAPGQMPVNPIKDGMIPPNEMGRQMQRAFGNKMVDGVKDTVEQLKLPGDVYKGKIDPLSDEAIQKASNLTGNLAGGGIGFAEKNALGSFGGRIKAYHGSPHDFDKFDIRRLGTGEGTAEQGHGLYFSGAPKTAEIVRDSISPVVMRDGAGKIVTPESFADTLRGAATQGLQGPGAARAGVISDRLAESLGRSSPGDLAERIPGMRAWGQRAYGAEFPAYDRALTAAQGFTPTSAGKMYEVALNAKPADMLSWEKGAGAYRNLSERLGSPKAASEELYRQGVPGIRYADHNTPGSENYVMFSDKDVSILRKYGVPGAAGAGGAAAALNPGESQAATTGMVRPEFLDGLKSVKSSLGNAVEQATKQHPTPKPYDPPKQPSAAPQDPWETPAGLAPGQMPVNPLKDGMIPPNELGRNMQKALGQKLTDGLKDKVENFKVYGDALQGKVDPMSDEGMKRIFGSAADMAGGGIGFAEKNAAGIFGGQLSKGADLAAMRKAQGMEASGIGRDQIWKETGWYRAVDDKWKYEMSDHQAPLSNIGNAKFQAVGSVQAGNLLKHPELSAAYPDIAKLPVVAEKNPGYAGSYNPNNNSFNLKQGMDRKESRLTQLHETQHAIQDREGFGWGASPAMWDRKRMVADPLYKQETLQPAVDRLRSMKETSPDAYNAYGDKLRYENQMALKYERDDWKVGASSEDLTKHKELTQKFWDSKGSDDIFAAHKKITELKDPDFIHQSDLEKFQNKKYWRSSGEVESRNVEARANMTPEERRAIPPWKTQDVPDELQWVRQREPMNPIPPEKMGPQASLGNQPTAWSALDNGGGAAALQSQAMQQQQLAQQQLAQQMQQLNTNAMQAVPSLQGMSGGLQGMIGPLTQAVPGLGQFGGQIQQLLQQLMSGMGGMGGGGGGLGSLFGGMGLFAEGGYSTEPVATGSNGHAASAWTHAPHYAEGTPNTSGGMPAVLHDNEAVIPLSRGRKVPVELTNQQENDSQTNTSGGGVTNLNFNVSSPNADSFKMSDRQLQSQLARMLQVANVRNN